MASRTWRNKSRAVTAAALAALCLSGIARGDDSGPLRVVVHINFSDTAQQGRGLENVGNILKAAAAAGLRAEVEVVCHAEGIGLVVESQTGHKGAVQALSKQGVRFVACENTLRKRSFRKEDLLPGVATVPSGAFEVVIKQRDGYSYFKP